MPPRRPPDERRFQSNTELRNGIARLEAAGNDYAARLILLDTVVSAEMINIEGTFEPPKVAFDAFKRLRTRPPLKVTGMNLDLCYDTGVGHFNIEHGEVDFDNGYGIAFLEPEEIASEEEKHHQLKLFRRGARGHVNARGVGLTPTSLVQDFFRECGVNIPLAPHPAEWNSVMPMLTASQSKVVTATARTALDPAHVLIVAEQTIETTPPKPNRGRRRKREWMQELSLQLVDYGGLSTRAFEAILRTGTVGSQARFQNLYEHTDARVMVPPRGKLGRALGVDTDFGKIETMELRKSQWLLPYIQMITAAVQSVIEPHA